jgi:outer membrane immunogenic protein
MRKTGFAAAALAMALSAGSAFAADLPSTKAPPYFPPPPPPPMWAGFYVGLNAGGTWSGSNGVSIETGPAFLTPLATPFGVAIANATWANANGVLGRGAGGFIGGGQIGYNWAFGQSFVAGVEADIQGVADAGSSTSAANLVALPVPPAPAGATLATALSTTKSLDYLGTVRGRLGWLFTPTLLVYGTGGLAYGGVSTNASVVQVNNPLGGIRGPWGAAGGFSDTRVGWTAGGGLEWMFWPNWSAKVEYLYYDLGSVNSSLGPLANYTPALFSLGVSQSRARFDGHIVRAGLNYHFNWGAPAPVVAKY